MIELYGKKYRVADLRRRVGNMDQIAGIRTVQLDDGNERPARAAILHTGTGLELTVLLDRCLDISAASHNQRAMGWRSATGDVAPQYFEAEGLRWLRSYFGGLVTTCGLTHVGAPRPESALLGNGLHGRIGHTPARNIKIVQEWQGGEFVMSVTGTMRETVVFGENLTLTRTVSTKLGERRFWIHDVVANEGFNDTKYMLLYHCNIGWPAVDAGSEMIAPSRFVAPRDAVAEDGKENWHKMDPPTHQYKEKCYYHDMVPAPDGSVTVAMANDGFARGEGFGVYVKYNKDELPRFVEWKQMGEQDYVIGFEPCNCGVEGRQVDEELGLLHTLKAGESKRVSLEFGVILSEKELKAIKTRSAKIKPQIVKSYKEFVKKP
ncbi:MAG TPA: aldose 1-epimerase family protein [Candidatus Hydrogenedentes bacterium]|nr:aldose 1-epimerase family protein [Candidatus Hydrogenedentota bacterium]HRT20556.1 aldose 1-epimerase family protein [Candidatus Hydrogenedentota bacterium]HRT65239.1 aldose 1-epimerase family protein [Candidatus Hydrogenedentota bacterium]